MKDPTEFRQRFDIYKKEGIKAVYDAGKPIQDDYSIGSWVDAIYANNPVEEFLGEPEHHYDFTQSEQWANAHGYYPDKRGHRDDRVKKITHPSHSSRGAWNGDKYELTDFGMETPNYTLFGLNDGNQDPQAILTYKNGIVIPEITVTPNGNYIYNPYDNIKIHLPKYDTGNPPQKIPKSSRALGNLFYRTASFLPHTRGITNIMDILGLSPDDKTHGVEDVSDVAGTTGMLLERTKKTPINNGTIAKQFAEAYNKPLMKIVKPLSVIDIAGDAYQWIQDAKAYGDALREEMPSGVYNSGITIDPNDYHDKGKSIHINPANKGKFNATKKRTGKTTEQLAHSKNPLTRKRAIFALNARKWKH